MYALAYVLLPADFSSLQDSLDRSLAPYKRGGEDDFALDQLAFDDDTAPLEEIWRAELDFDRTGGGLRYGDAPPLGPYMLDGLALRRFLDERGVDRWRGRLIDVEPDFTAYGHRFTNSALDPRTGRFGRWLNPIGHWDWWELGGRFDGFITGQPRAARDDNRVNSGPSAGRAMVAGIGQALVDQLGGELPSVEAEIEANVELGETVLDRLLGEEEPSWPTVVVRPVGSAPDPARWVEDEHFHPMPPEARSSLGLPPDASSRDARRVALERHRDGVVAAVAYHC